MLKIEKIKTHIILPATLLEAIDETAGSRKRSKFIIEAVEEKLRELKIQRALEAAAGCWRDENHPDLRTQENIRSYLKKAREDTNNRIKQFSA